MKSECYVCARQVDMSKWVGPWPKPLVCGECQPRVSPSSAPTATAQNTTASATKTEPVELSHFDFGSV